MANANMIGEIANTEERAEQIRKDALLQGKELVNKTKADMEQRLKETDDREREKTKSALMQAEIDGKALAESILNEAITGIEKRRSAAEQRIPAAVDYLLERVETLK
ncbi:MAG: hypothetical protein Q4C01_05005 [Clostridia bacterium]|nr:hypothetical protein [Clostridia bacterium]